MREKEYSVLFWDIERMVMLYIEMWNIEGTHIVWERTAFGCGHIYMRASVLQPQGIPRRQEKT